MEKLDSVIFFTVEKLIKVYRRFAQNQIQQHGYDITIDQWLVLRTLQEQKHLSQHEIADLLFKDFASITRIIELLVKKQYVQRSINEADRRKFELEITEEGKKIIEELYPIVIEYRKQALLGFSLDEIQHLKGELERIINNIHNDSINNAKE